MGELLDNICKTIEEDNCIMLFFGFICLSLGDKTLKPFSDQNFSSVLNLMYMIIIPVGIQTTIESQLLLGDSGDRNDLVERFIEEY